MNCPTCNGLGKIDCSSPEEWAWMSLTRAREAFEMECWHCNGKGSFPSGEMPDPAQAWADWNMKQMSQLFTDDLE